MEQLGNDGQARRHYGACAIVLMSSRGSRLSGRRGDLAFLVITVPDGLVQA